MKSFEARLEAKMKQMENEGVTDQSIWSFEAGAKWAMKARLEKINRRVTNVLDTHLNLPVPLCDCALLPEGPDFNAHLWPEEDE